MSKLIVNNIIYNYQSNVIDPAKSTYVFLHGFLGSKIDFHKLIEDFPEQFLVLDLLGFGANRFQNVPPERFLQNNQVSDLESIFTKLNLKNISLVGYSMGGRLALAYALKFPRRTNELILESTTAGIDGDDQRKLRREHDEKLAASLEQNGIEKFIENWENLPLFATQKEVNPSSFEFMHNQRITQNPINVANSLRNMGTGKQPNYWHELSTLRIPKVKIIVGSEDEKFLKIGHRLQTLISNSSEIIVKNAGHNIHFEHPNSFKKAIFDDSK
ncbi:2-succinyl-6-hydroxy-2,4-cyclohexadiene-1-carboxylate synthase [Companilactobacillus ginsenosidimutans]|uniref:Putative 2-succinyl-6-hydroxy-2,4-cyclohexadiene-1-carboxylate synthase n=1 Tax=Companilactobacillus ginsenosidimutans TaxID=1007676 RepID=A0A0H4QHI7_9LACO|nr:2-succinyl-6-hydroxy-2,4-cyclohexadiene-1-carboxylate synthase [Companilactobacillus ginsenosidimutans]AKP66481.1 hypothetical protein ABM34_02200 [Companilactobacillus ginsenosidimutans]